MNATSAIAVVANREVISDLRALIAAEGLAVSEPSACDAGAGAGSRECRVFYRGHRITQQERERIQRAGSGGAVMTPEGIVLFDTLAELDRFDARRAAEASR